MISEARTKNLREKSGTITYSDPLTSFLYILMRDYLPAGDVEAVVQAIVAECGQETTYTNGWLARYANDLAEDIRASGTKQLQSALESAFADRTSDVHGYTKPLVIKKAQEELSENDIERLAKEIEVIGEGTPAESNVENMLADLISAGQISDTEAEKFRLELQEIELEERMLQMNDEAQADDLEVDITINEEPEPKKCCGQCSGKCDSDAKWEHTEKFLEELDKELEELAAPAVKEIPVVYVEPRAISTEEAKDISNMLDGMSSLLNPDEKKV